jgi:hypothetical protein
VYFANAEFSSARGKKTKYEMTRKVTFHYFFKPQEKGSRYDPAPRKSMN